MGLLLLGWRVIKRTEPAALGPFRFRLGVLVAMPLAWTAQAAFAVPRPSDLYANDLVWVLGAPDSLYAFPSGHAVYTAAVVACLLPLGPWPFRLLLLALAAAVGWSRVALGAHFPAGGVAGSPLGGGFGVATYGWGVSLGRARAKWRRRARALPAARPPRPSPDRSNRSGSPRHWPAARRAARLRPAPVTSRSRTSSADAACWRHSRRRLRNSARGRPWCCRA